MEANMKKFTAILLVILLVLTCVATVACRGFVIVYLENYDGYRTKPQLYDPNEPLPTPTREGYVFDGWYLDRDFNIPFVEGTEMENNFHLYAKWIPYETSHKHVFESYFTYGKCIYDDCEIYGRNVAEAKYFSLSDYTLDRDMSVIDGHYNALVACIQSGSGSNNQFDTLYDQYYYDVDAVVEQYDLAYLLSDMYASFIDKYYEAGEYYDKTIAQFYGLYELIYNSSYSSYFYYGWDSDEIQQARDLAAMYDNSGDTSETRKIMQDYATLLDEIEEYLDSSGAYNPTSAQYSAINSLYSRLVAANNAAAASAGYSGSANYMDYAYENVYYREYTPSEVTQMRTYVKEVIAPIFADIAEEFYRFYFYEDYYGGSYFSTSANANYYMGLIELPIVNTVNATIANANAIYNTVNYIADYYKYLGQVNGIDFLGEAEKLYQNGNYFTGTGTGAYTTMIKGKPLVYFQEDGYDTAFTFVHEFGHYYDFVHNGSITASMDHSETQSQGDEMLFLAWLMNNKPNGISNGYTAVELSQLFDFLSTIVLATAVDELEQAAYSGTYNGATITDYNQTFKAILSTYSGANNYLNTDYWFYVVFDNAAYYISYAMSALPAIEIFAKAGNSGLDAARESYLKLFTYSSNNSFLGSDGYGGTTVTASYETILNWCGLHSAFQSELYTTIETYFNGRS